MWLLLILAVHQTDPRDIPGRVSLEFSTQESCQLALQTLQWQIKFPQFKVVAQCTKRS